MGEEKYENEYPNCEVVLMYLAFLALCDVMRLFLAVCDVMCPTDLERINKSVSF